MSLTIDQLGQAEDMSRKLEEWGLLAAYEHLLTEMSKRRVSIPTSHLYEYAAREFERFAARRKDGIHDSYSKREQRKAVYRQRQVARRIHDTAREHRFATALVEQHEVMKQQQQQQQQQQQLQANESILSMGANITTSSPSNDFVSDFLMEGVDVKETEAALATEERGELLTGFLMQGVVVKDEDDEDEENLEISFSTLGQALTQDVIETAIETVSPRLQPTLNKKPTLEILLNRNPSNQDLPEIEHNSNDNLSNDLASLKIFGPILLQVIFDSFDKQEDKEDNEDNEDKEDASSLNVSSDLSSGSDVSCFTESDQESSK